MSMLNWFHRTASLDAISLLKQDHDAFRDLLKKLNATSARASTTRERLFSALRKLLVAHETIEERILYPALEKHAKAKDIVLEGYQEHHVADLLLRELRSIPVRSPDWGPKVHVMGEGIEHHLAEEERKMFPAARRLLGEPVLMKLGARMATRRKAMLAAGIVTKPATVEQRGRKRATPKRRRSRRLAS